MTLSRTPQSDEDSTGRDASASSSSSSPPASKPVQAATQSFSFVTITNPKQAKDKKNKKAVRSHVMYDYAASKKRQQGKPSTHSRQPSNRRTVDSDNSDELSPLEADDVPADGAEDALTTVRDIARSLVPRRGPNGKDSTIPAIPNKQDLSRYYQALLALKRHGSDSRTTQEVLVQDDDTLERVWKAGFVKPYSIRGLGDADPFFVLPQFRNPMIYMAELKMWCTRRFGTKAMSVHWVPALAKDRLTYLAALCLGATDMDVASGLRTESALTVAVKTEVIEMVNEQLARPEKQYTDDTIMAIQLLLCGEIATGNEWIWKIHEAGITRILLHRGGLQNLGINGDLAVVVFSIIVTMHILRESQPDDVYKRYASVKTRSVSAQRALPESPVYCPRSNFFTIARSKYCSERLYDLLSDMRDVTELFIDQDRDTSTEEADSSSPEAGTAVAEGCKAAQNALAKIQKIPQFNAALDAPSYSAWTFEACRIASLIYSTAISAQIPFSEAAVLVDLQGESEVAFGDGTLPHCLHKLRDAVVNSNVGDSWADMIGVLLWVTLIGGAAARKPPSCGVWTDNDEWTRKYMTSTAVRVLVLLCFEHSSPTVSSLRRLNEVQRLLTPAYTQSLEQLQLTA